MYAQIYLHIQFKETHISSTAGLTNSSPQILWRTPLEKEYLMAARETHSVLHQISLFSPSNILLSPKNKSY